MNKTYITTYQTKEGNNSISDIIYMVETEQTLVTYRRVGCINTKDLKEAKAELKQKYSNAIFKVHTIFV